MNMHSLSADNGMFTYDMNILSTTKEETEDLLMPTWNV